MRFSIEAEQSVIGGLLIDPSKLDDVCELITEADYYNSDNRIIFAAICAMANDNQPVDVITLSEKLDAIGDLERVGGIGYLVEMHNNTPSAANIMSYAKIIADRSMDRRIVEAGARMCQLGESDGDVDEKLNQLHGELEALERKDDAGYVDFNSVIKGCVQRIDDRFRGKAINCIKTGFDALDDRLLIEETDLWVIAARPSMGKTALAMNIAYNVARSGKEVIVFSLEMSKEQLTDRLLSSAANIKADILKSGKLDDEHWSSLSAGVVKLKDMKIHIIEIPAIDINRAMAIARKFAKRGNVGLIVVDYLQLMTTNSDKRFDVVSEVSRKLKVMAKTVKAPVIALSQLSRKCDERADSRPVMSDLRESGQIEQDADIISFIYRDEYYNEDSPNKGTAEVITRKYRNGEIGTDILGTQLQYSRFTNVDYSNYVFEYQSKEKQIYGEGNKGFD